MILFVTVVHIIVCLMLVGIILLQPGRGQGLTGSAFGDTSQSVFGTKTADVLTKATTVAAVLFMVTCIALSAMTARKSQSLYSNFKDKSPITLNQIQRAVEEAQKKADAAGNQTPATVPVTESAAPVATAATPETSKAPSETVPATAA